VLAPEECNGMVLSYNYFEKIATAENKTFLAAFRKRFGADYPNVTELAMGTYQGFKLWAEAVKKAGSIDRMKVIEALESGISINAPSGKVTVDGASHHCILDVSLAEVKNKKLDILQTFAQQAPSDTSAVCNLKKKPTDNQQYVIKV
jgi:branched-chain amino acid transport system substrate-binding protein